MHYTAIDRIEAENVVAPGARLRDIARNGAAMSQYYKQIQHGDGEAAGKLRERLARKDMGDAAYDKAVSYADDRSFKIFGVVFIVAVAAVVLAATGLGY